MRYITCIMLCIATTGASDLSHNTSSSTKTQPSIVQRMHNLSNAIQDSSLQKNLHKTPLFSSIAYVPTILDNNEKQNWLHTRLNILEKAVQNYNKNCSDYMQVIRNENIILKQATILDIAVRQWYKEKHYQL